MTKNTYLLLWSTARLIKASNLPSSTCHKTQCLTRLYILGNYCQNQIINVCWPVTSGWSNVLFNNIYNSGYLSPVATLTCTFNLWLFIVEWMWHRNRWCCLTCITLIFYYCFFLWWCQMCTQAANSCGYRENNKLQHTPFKVSGSNSHINFQLKEAVLYFMIPFAGMVYCHQTFVYYVKWVTMIPILCHTPRP